MPAAPAPPDLSKRPWHLRLERHMAAAPEALYLAFTDGIDRWFAAPGTLATRAEVGTAFYFATEHAGERHPHYGRYLRLEPGRLVELTWLTEGGTQGAETVVTVELQPQGTGTRLTLTHAGFPAEALRDRHAQAWPQVLAHLDATVRPA